LPNTDARPFGLICSARRNPWVMFTLISLSIVAFYGC
jgi:hypothetical protein